MIKPPELSFDMSEAVTATTLAMCSSDGERIYVKLFETPSLDSYFSIAHELRHIWQIRTAPDVYMNSYKTREELNLREYNLQAAELDANAFASLVMIRLFSQRPLFDGLPVDIKQMIFVRTRELSLQYDF